MPVPDSSGGAWPWSKPRIDVTTRLGARLVLAVQSRDKAIREREVQAYELKEGDVIIVFSSVYLRTEKLVKS